MKPAPSPTPAALFEPHRAALRRVAYRMLGTVSDAEDMVQDTFLRWQRAGEPTLDDQRAWLTKTCVRLCLDRLKSAQRTREQYVGPWLPEPLINDGHDQVPVELNETLCQALLVTLERLRPVERAVFLLHDVFDYEFTEVAEILERTPAGCRQLAVRARRALASQRPTLQRREVDRASFERLSAAFFGAVGEGDLAGLRSLLAEDVVLRADGGGKAIAARRELVGPDEVSRFLMRALAPNPEVPLEPIEVWFNGAPGALLYLDGELVTALQLEVRDDRVVAVHAHRNPDKLALFHTSN